MTPGGAEGWRFFVAEDEAERSRVGALDHESGTADTGVIIAYGTRSRATTGASNSSRAGKRMSEEQRLSIWKIMLYMGVTFLIGAPLYAYLWGTLNEFMSGFFNPVRLMISAPVLVIFVALLIALSRKIQVWEKQSLE